ncbi:MAG: hypothetical protein IKN64_02515 [Desulfovibrio sp.]|nr:hypothetical protein [Desulfovibrio sp.]
MAEDKQERDSWKKTAQHGSKARLSIEAEPKDTRAFPIRLCGVFLAQRPFSPQTYLAYGAITGLKTLAQATPQSSLATLPLAQKKEPFRRRAFLMLLSKTLTAMIALALSLLDFPRKSSNLLSLGLCLFPGVFCLKN